MANNPGECQQMIDAGRKANSKLMVAYRAPTRQNFGSK
jgi:predicted dehydrogenase